VSLTDHVRHGKYSHDLTLKFVSPNHPGKVSALLLFPFSALATLFLSLSAWTAALPPVPDPTLRRIFQFFPSIRGDDPTYADFLQIH
jgi:hypothetical protein